MSDQNPTKMEMILMISLCFTTFLALFLLKPILKRTATKVNLPPSPWRLPVIGNLHQVGLHPHRSLRSLSFQYGPLMLLHFGRIPVLVVSSGEVAHEVMKTHDLKFANRPRSKAVHKIMNGGQDVVFAPYGEYWRQMKDMFIGGTSTTLTLLEWTMTELIRHPECMKKLQDEIRSSSTPNSSYIKEEEVENMKYLKAVIKEVLRLHPSLPLILPRVLSEDVKLMGYNMTAGTEVIINAWAIQRDTAVWGLEAEEFKPERHLDSPIDYRGKDLNYIPFGSGRRICPGIGFALGLAEVAVANLVGRFDWRVEVRPKGDQSDIAEAVGIDVCRKFPLIAFPSSVV